MSLKVRRRRRFLRAALRAWRQQTAGKVSMRANRLLDRAFGPLWRGLAKPLETNVSMGRQYIPLDCVDLPATDPVVLSVDPGFGCGSTVVVARKDRGSAGVKLVAEFNLVRKDEHVSDAIRYAYQGLGRKP